jgi:hypothetical protein
MGDSGGPSKGGASSTTLGASACVLHAVALIRTVVQRLFSTFAGGLPGVGLLILRVAVAVPLLSAGLKTAASASPVTLELAAAGAALFLLAGLWTPLAGAVIAAAELALAAVPWMRACSAASTSAFPNVSLSVSSSRPPKGVVTDLAIWAPPRTLIEGCQPVFRDSDCAGRGDQNDR